MTYRVLAVSGSLRKGSVNQAVVETARLLAPAGVVVHVHARLADLPPFNPDDDREPLHPAVSDLRGAIGTADGLLFCTPEYAGALPGSLKNLLDWTVGGAEMDGKPVGWINAASVAAPTGGEDAHASLRKVLGYLGARIVEPACVRIPLSRDRLGADGLIADEAVRQRIGEVLRELASSRTGVQPSA